MKYEIEKSAQSDSYCDSVQNKANKLFHQFWCIFKIKCYFCTWFYLPQI